ncbi:hypothetical protein GCM10008942_29320 [Rhizomicrobium electricum]|uniref:Uncharacterized protein n=1 Tax=Rhizomicrobium electricum TaxID=480070 RepID=A0ABN1EZQ7_9PROT
MWLTRSPPLPEARRKGGTAVIAGFERIHVTGPLNACYYLCKQTFTPATLCLNLVRAAQIAARRLATARLGH